MREVRRRHDATRGDDERCGREARLESGRSRDRFRLPIRAGPAAQEMKQRLRGDNAHGHATRAAPDGRGRERREATDSGTRIRAGPAGRAGDQAALRRDAARPAGRAPRRALRGKNACRLRRSVELRRALRRFAHFTGYLLHLRLNGFLELGRRSRQLQQCSETRHFFDVEKARFMAQLHIFTQRPLGFSIHQSTYRREHSIK